MKKYAHVPFRADTWEPDADGFTANLCTDCGTPVRYGSRHGFCLELKLPKSQSAQGNTMNERIKELVGQAKFMAEESINKQISANAELNAFAEKFAELIIKECANIASVGDTDNLDQYDRGFQNGRDTSAYLIRNTFGVEE